MQWWFFLKYVLFFADMIHIWGGKDAISHHKQTGHKIGNRGKFEFCFPSRNIMGLYLMSQSFCCLTFFQWFSMETSFFDKMLLSLSLLFHWLPFFRPAVSKLQSTAQIKSLLPVWTSPFNFLCGVFWWTILIWSCLSFLINY